jgi:hypothetical protein
MMSKDAAAADRAAAAYWRRVAALDRADVARARSNAHDLSAAARREDQPPQTPTQRRASALRPG